MNQKLDKRIIVTGISILVVIIAIGIYIIVGLTLSNKPDDDVVISATPNSTMASGKVDKPEENSSGLQIDYMDSYFYNAKESVGFNFYIVTVRVKSEDTINVNLDAFTTSENVNLSKVTDYVTNLEKNEFYLGKENVVYQLISLENEAMFNIFVPVTQNNNAISITCSLDEDFNTTLNPNHNVSKIDDLFYQAEDVISDGKTYQMKVSEAFNASGDMFTQDFDGQKYDYTVPSTVSIFAFKLDAVSLYGDVVEIESATYVPSNSSEVFTALDKTIESDKYNNIVGEEITDSQTGYLFFEAFSNYNEEVFYTGVLKLKLLNNDNEIVVNVDLNPKR